MIKRFFRRLFRRNRLVVLDTSWNFPASIPHGFMFDAYGIYGDIGLRLRIDDAVPVRNLILTATEFPEFTLATGFADSAQAQAWVEENIDAIRAKVESLRADAAAKIAEIKASRVITSNL